MINLDEVMQRKDMRTVSSGEIRCLFAEIERLRIEVKLLREDRDAVTKMMVYLADKLNAFVKQLP